MANFPATVANSEDWSCLNPTHLKPTDFQTNHIVKIPGVCQLTTNTTLSKINHPTVLRGLWISHHRWQHGKLKKSKVEQGYAFLFQKSAVKQSAQSMLAFFSMLSTRAY
jgi:hypothetical protein